MSTNQAEFRESSAIYVIKHLMEERAKISVYDPKVSEAQMRWDLEQKTEPDMVTDLVTVHGDPYEAAKGAHAIVVLTEWDEFKEYDYKRIHGSMQHPAAIFDGRLILDQKHLREIGFRTFAIGQSPLSLLESSKTFRFDPRPGVQFVRSELDGHFLLPWTA